MKNTTLMFAYGMNTNTVGMSIRCPKAQDLGKAELLDHKMVFKYHCDVIEMPGHNAPGVLWKITKTCLASLDVLEGFPVYYKRKYVTVLHNGKKVNALVYYMVDGHTQEQPDAGYYDMVLQGYNEHGISEEPLVAGLPKVFYPI